MALYLGWIVAAFLAGSLLGKWPKKRKMKLHKRFDKLNICKGLSYVEILRRVKSAPRITERNAHGETERLWIEEGYSIMLIFDPQDICLGVQDERLDQADV